MRTPARVASVADLALEIRSGVPANQRGIVDSLDEKGALRRGLTIDHASDILWTLNHPNT